MSQENPFADTHTLIIQTDTLVTSSIWQQQLQALPNVKAIETPYHPFCWDQTDTLIAVISGLSVAALVVAFFWSRKRRNRAARPN